MPGEQRNDAVEILLVVGGIGFELLLARLGGADRVLERIDLEIGQREARLGALERRLVWPRIDHEEQRALGQVLVVANRQFDDRTAHVRRDADDVGAHVGVVGARVDVVEAQHVETGHDRADDDCEADDAAGHMQNPRTPLGMLRRPPSARAQMRLKKIIQTTQESSSARHG